MRMKLIILFFLGFIPYYIFAEGSVVVEDRKATEREQKSWEIGLDNVKELLLKMENTTTSIQKQADIKDLIKTEADIGNSCKSFCNQNEFNKVESYLTDINNKFRDNLKAAGDALNNAASGVQSAEDAITQLNSFWEKANPVALEIKIQKAAASALDTMRADFSDIKNMLQLQERRKEVEHKIEKSKADSVNKGFSQLDL